MNLSMFFIAISEGITCIRKVGKHLQERRCPTRRIPQIIIVQMSCKIREKVCSQKLPAIQYFVNLRPCTGLCATRPSQPTSKCTHSFRMRHKRNYLDHRHQIPRCTYVRTSRLSYPFQTNVGSNVARHARIQEASTDTHSALK